MRSISAVAVFAVLSVVSCPWGCCEEPTGIELARRSAVAAGGKEAHQRIKTIVLRGVVSIPKAGAQGTIVTQYAAPDRARVTVDMGTGGKTVQRISAGQGWESSSRAGERTLDRKETDRLLESISMRDAFEPETVYASIENKGREEVDGVACYRVELKRADGSLDQVFYGAKSGLPLKTIVSRPTLSGSSVIESRVSDYKDFSGIKLPTRLTQHMTAFDVTYEIQIESVEINVKLDDKLFAQP